MSARGGLTPTDGSHLRGGGVKHLTPIVFFRRQSEVKRKTRSLMDLVVMALQSVAVHTLYGVDARAVHVKANLDEGKTDIEIEEPAVVYEKSLGGFCDPYSLRRTRVLRAGPPQSSLLSYHYEH